MRCKVMNKRMLIAASAVAAVGVVGIGTSYVSPYLAMHQMHSAMVQQDADAFSSHVDFPMLRENLRGQFMIVMEHQFSNSPGLKDNPFAGLGMMMAAGLVNQMIDTAISPAGVMAMMAQGAAKPPATAQAPTAATASSVSAGKQEGPVKYAVRYKNWSTVTATAHSTDGAALDLVFKRHGLWSWKLAGINLPLDKLEAG